jgi:hypothetical protein
MKNTNFRCWLGALAEQRCPGTLWLVSALPNGRSGPDAILGPTKDALMQQVDTQASFSNLD